MLASGLGSRGMAAADCHLPNVISLSVAISACEKGQQWQRALSLLVLVQQTRVLPGVISYSALISACEKGQRGQQALGLLALIQQTAILPRFISIQPPSVLVRSLQWQQAPSFGCDAADYCSAWRHLILSRVRCLQEGPSMAANLVSLSFDASYCHSACRHFSLSRHQCL